MKIKKELLQDVVLISILSGLVTPLALKSINPSLNLGYSEFAISLTSNFIMGLFIYFVLVEGNLKDYFNSLTEFLFQMRSAKKAENIEKMKTLLEGIHINTDGKDFISKFSKEFTYFLNTLYQDELLDTYQNEINGIFTKTLGSKELASKIYQFLYDKFGIIAASFYSWNNRQTEVIYSVNFNPTLPESIGEIVETDKVKAIRVDNLMVKFPGDFRLKVICVIPLVTESWKGAAIVGKIAKLKGTEILFYRRIKHSMAQAFRNAYVYELLRKESLIDPLTGLYNRRFGIRRLEELIKLATRENRTLTLGIMDIDDFKKINDTYGHLAGDYILKEIGEIIQETLRESDLAVRYGGEEFLLALYNADENRAKTALERIKDAIEKHPFTFKNKKIPVTVTVGYHVFSPENGEGLELLMNLADKALYRGKSSGKNRIIKY